MKSENETKKRTVCKYCGEEISNEYGSPVDGFPGGWCVVDGRWLTPWCKKAPEGKEQHEPQEETQPIPEPETHGRDQSIPEESYFDRNQAAMVIGKFAQMLGFTVGIKPDKEWPILYVELPTGQVSWHLPAGELMGSFPIYEGQWDGHDVQEKRERLRKFIEEDE